MNKLITTLIFIITSFTSYTQTINGVARTVTNSKDSNHTFSNKIIITSTRVIIKDEYGVHNLVKYSKPFNNDSHNGTIWNWSAKDIHNNLYNIYFFKSLNVNDSWVIIRNLSSGEVLDFKSIQTHK